MGDLDEYLTLKPQQQGVGHQWKTGIVKHLKGAEQRSSYFTWPRFITQTRFSLSENIDTWFRRKLYTSSHKVWGVPLWHDQFTMTATATSGATGFSVESVAKRHLTAGREIILIDKLDPSRYHATALASTSTNRVHLATAINHNYTSSGSWACPVVESRITVPSGVRVSQVSAAFVDVRGEEDYSTDRSIFYTPPTSTAATYLGHEVVDFRFNHSKTFKYDHPLKDFKTLGKHYYESFYEDDMTHINTEFQADLITRDEIWDFWTTFDSAKGRYNAFWLPTWHRDMVFTDGCSSGDVVLDITSDDYDTAFLSNVVINRHILFYFPDKTWTCRKVVDYDDGELTISTAIGVTLTASEASKTMICFLIFSRFDMDTAIMQYQAAQVAKIGFETKGLVEEAI